MTSKEVQKMIIDLENEIERFGGMIQFNYQLDILRSYKQDLERLEEVEKENKELREQHEKDFEIICRQAYLLNNKHIDRPIIETYQKALDKACERLEYYAGECPFSQELMYETNCDLNCKNTYKECWKKYFLEEVLE